MSISPSYWLGETVRLRVTFTDEAGAALAVSGAAMAVKKPGGSTASVALTGDGDGKFYGDVPTDEAGTWFARATCSSPAGAAVEAQFTVRASNVS